MECQGFTGFHWRISGSVFAAETDADPGQTSEAVVEEEVPVEEEVDSSEEEPAEEVEDPSEEELAEEVEDPSEEEAAEEVEEPSEEEMAEEVEDPSEEEAVEEENEPETLDQQENADEQDKTDQREQNLDDAARDNNENSTGEAADTELTEPTNGQVETVSEDAAVSASASGTCGDNLSWDLNSYGILTIRGKGEMTDNSFTYVDNRDDIKKVFMVNKNIKHVQIH